MNKDAVPEPFLPDFCAIRMVFAVVITAELLSVVLTLAAGFNADTFWRDLSLRSLFVQWVALSSSAILCLARSRLAYLSHTSEGLIAWGVIQLTTLLTALAAWHLHVTAESGGFGPYLVQALGVSAIVGAVVLRYLYEQFRKHQRDVAASRARFAMLQARIRPHFLFNSMNTIASLTRSDPALAEETVHDLADLFRASLSGSERLTTLNEELELARGYLRIEQMRLGDRLRIEWDLEDLPGTIRVPPLILQPLLENAVYHGIEPSPEGGDIVISGRHRRGVVNLSVRNTLPPGGAGSERKGNHMAQQNVRDRLLVAFGDDAGVTLGSVENQYQVRLHFPTEPVPE